MQTFLPIPSLAESAKVLDNRRCGKQRVEVKQILIALGVPVGDHDGNPSSRWRHHPAVQMWRGFERYLAHYGIAVCGEWKSRGFRDSLEEQFIESSRWIVSAFHDISPSSVCGVPPWFGLDEVHSSHRSNLLRKHPEHYSQFGWAETNDIPYFWPIKEKIA